VVAAGNHAEKRYTSELVPQLFGGVDSPMIIVGGVDSDGNLWDQTTKDDMNVITVSAKADYVHCADVRIRSKNDVLPPLPQGKTDNTIERDAAGTSFAAPAVAGE
jgi:hypothetical protein